VERRTTLALDLDYKLEKRLWGKFRYAWEDYDVFDFAQDPAVGRELQAYMRGVDPAATKALFLGARKPGFDAHIFQISANY
jgi:hypothetical protein